MRWLAGVFLLLVLLVGAAIAYLWTRPFPRPVAEPQATIVFDATGKPLANFSEQDRVDVPLSQVPKVVIDAVVSTEDRHFFSEGAINPTSIVRAAFDDITGRGGLQGGSTITQQYVKQAYLNSKRTLVRKIEEAALAMRLSHRESKQQILHNYLNIIYWGRGAYGVEAASQAYFGKNVAQLQLPEASLLAALIKEPETADPAHDPALARRVQTETLNAMVRDKQISVAQASAVERMRFASYVTSPPSQAAGAQKGRTAGESYFLSAVRAELYAKYGKATVDGGGLRVMTTLDPTLQRQAYNAVYGQGPGALNPAGGDPSAALVSVGSGGKVRALVGGQSYSRSHVDLALGAAGGGSGRQAGSTFKAFMLAALIKDGYSVESVLPSPPEVVLPGGNSNGSAWTVTNYEGETVSPYMSVVDATAESINTVYAQLVAKLGAAKLDAMAEAMGINPGELKGAYPSQVLGSAEVSPIEMAAAYATLSDGGVYHTPLLITKVTTSAGRDLPLPVKPSSRTVLSPEQAAVETYVLQQVVNHGTGTAAGGLAVPVAGKTGTTEYAGDAWFVGYTPHLTTALWMGYASSDRFMSGFRGLYSVAGGSIPAELWHSYMAAALASNPAYGGRFHAVASLSGRQFRPWPLQGDRILVSSGSGATYTAYPSTAPSYSPPPTYLPPHVYAPSPPPTSPPAEAAPVGSTPSTTSTSPPASPVPTTAATPPPSAPPTTATSAPPTSTATTSTTSPQTSSTATTASGGGTGSGPGG